MVKRYLFVMTFELVLDENNNLTFRSNVKSLGMNAQIQITNEIQKKEMISNNGAWRVAFV